MTVASPPPLDPDYARRVGRAHESFLGGELTPGGVRAIVGESWRRSLLGGVDPDHGEPPVELAVDQLRDYRDGHPIAASIGVVRDLLTTSAVDADHIVAVVDASARLLWVEGSPSLLRRAESMHFVEGACWAEEVAGTNAPGLAVTLGVPAQVFATEHFSRSVQPWSCTAVPVHDPDTHQLLGAVDLTGGDHVASPQALALVRATVAAMEAEIRLLRVQRRAAPPASGSDGVLKVLGHDHGRLELDGRSVRLSPRHTELLLLLLLHPDGLTAEQLAVALNEHEVSLVTVRAEMSRLRRIVGDHVIASQPYRTSRSITSDALQVRDLLRRGQLRRALADYVGPVLPRSESPGVVGLREEIAGAIRHVVLGSRNADLALNLASRTDHRDDLELWESALRHLPSASPRRAYVEGNIRRLHDG